MKKLHSVRNQRGAAVVEFAVVFPMLFLVLLAVLSALWLLTAKSAMTGAARDGARFASIRHDMFDCDLDCDGEHPREIARFPTEAEVGAFVTDRVGTFGPVTVDLDPSEEEGATYTGRVANAPITVTVSRDLPVIFKPVASFFGWDELEYTSEAKVRAE